MTRDLRKEDVEIVLGSGASTFERDCAMTRVLNAKGFDFTLADFDKWNATHFQLVAAWLESDFADDHRPSFLDRYQKTATGGPMAAKKNTEKKSPTEKPKTKAQVLKEADVKIESFSQKLRIELDDDGKLDRSQRLAHLVSDKAVQNEAAKAASAHIRAQIKEIDAEISRLSTEIRDGATYDDVRCERRFIYRTGKIEEVRLDTNEKTFERAMSLSERQVPLDLEAKKKAREADKSKLKEKVAEAVGDRDAKPENDEEAPEVPQTDEPPESSESSDDEESGGEAAE